jgi:hypothetical protein
VIAALLMVEGHQQASEIEAMSSAMRAFYFRHVVEYLGMKADAIREATKQT